MNKIEEFATDMESREEDFYSRETRSRLIEDEALSSEEDGFMQGYEFGGNNENNWNKEENSSDEDEEGDLDEEDWESWDRYEKSQFEGIY